MKSSEQRSRWAQAIGPLHAMLSLERGDCMNFGDRADAGRRLAQALGAYKGQDPVVFALPRGGVVLGVEVARALEAPLDLIVTRKIGHPSSSEYAIAAVAEDGHLFMNQAEVSALPGSWFDAEVQEKQTEARRRRELFLGGRAPVAARDKTAIIVDDGLATGLTMAAAVNEVRHRRPRHVVIAVPTGAADTIEALRPMVDEIVCLYIPSGGFGSVGQYYEKFPQIADEEVVAMLNSFDATSQKTSVE